MATIITTIISLKKKKIINTKCNVFTTFFSFPLCTIIMMNNLIFNLCIQLFFSKKKHEEEKIKKKTPQNRKKNLINKQNLGIKEYNYRRCFFSNSCFVYCFSGFSCFLFLFNISIHTHTHIHNRTIYKVAKKRKKNFNHKENI